MASKVEEFKNSKEYKLWTNIKEVLDNLGLKSDYEVTKIDDMNEYWEPLLERIFKLGVCFKKTGKSLKEIRVNWLRACFYYKNETEFTIDDKFYAPVEKGPFMKGQQVKREFQYLVSFLQEHHDRIDSSNITNIKKEFQKKVSEFFSALIDFATKENNYRYVKANIKEILKQLINLKKANYKLFLLESKLEGYYESSIFEFSKNMKEFEAQIKIFFQDEEFKMKRDVEIEKLETFMYKKFSEKNFQYSFNDTLREEYYTKEAMDFRLDALRLKFEEAFEGMLKYLYEKKKMEFPVPIDVKKLFRNIHILQDDQNHCVKYYINLQKSYLKKMKIHLYEMKLNGTARIKMPITKNVEIINIIKSLYDTHRAVDYLMGNKIKYDQFVFFYNCLKFVYESNLKEDFATIKKKNLMEEAIPNYIILCSLRQAAVILEKMRVKSYCDKGIKFDWGDYYQIERKPLEHENNYIFETYDLTESDKKLLQNNLDLKEGKETFEKEMKEFGGRFWILEGFFNPEDRKLWLSAIEMLRNMNTLVIDDIRDFLLTHYPKEEVAPKNTNSSRIYEKKSTNKMLEIVDKRKESKSNMIHIKTKGKTESLKKDQADKTSHHNDSEDEFIINLTTKVNINLNLNNLRPPNVWNFPVDLYKKDDDKKNIIKTFDSVKAYSDNRVKEFLDLLYIIKSKTLTYCSEVKDNLWKYYFESTLTIFDIKYNFNEKKSMLNSQTDKFAVDTSVLSSI